MISQEEMMRIFEPIIRSKGEFYEKKGKVWAKKAHKIENIVTNTADGKETSNTANIGDMIIKNQTEAKEKYVISKSNFDKRYLKIDSEEDHEGYFEYLAIGKIQAIRFDEELRKEVNLGEKFDFQAAWKSKMVCKENDYLACPLDFSQVYRIANKEFFETYSKID